MLINPPPSLKRDPPIFLAFLTHFHILNIAMKTILAAIDFSDSSHGVIQSSINLAKSFNAHLHILHVVEPQPSYTAYGFTPDDFPALNSFQERTCARSKEQLEDLSHSLMKSSQISISPHTTEGPPLHSILEFAQTINADLIVVGSHGHGAIASFLLGTVADGLVRKSVIPTLVVPSAR